MRSKIKETNRAYKSFVLMLSLVFMMVTCINIQIFASTSGNFGDNIIWNFNSSNGTLTVSGTGKIGNTENLSDIQSSITKIVIEDGIDSIGEEAFHSLTELSEVIMADSVTAIEGDALGGDNAFSGCKKLKSVKLSKNLLTIGYNAFYGCSELTDIEIPYGVTDIGSQAFAYCKSLKSIHIPNSVTSMGYGVFSGCTSLTSIEIPNSVTSLDRYVFSGCTSLSNIIVPNSVTSITGKNTFATDNKSSQIYIYNKNLELNANMFGTDRASGIIYSYSGSKAEAFCAGNSNWVFQSLPGTPVSGTAKYSDGSSIDGELYVGLVNVMGESQNKFATVDNDGNYKFDYITNGTWKFALYQNGTEIARTDSIVINDGDVSGDTNFSIAPVTYGSLGGNVYNHESYPVKGATVMLNNGLTVTTDSYGAYNFDNLQDGSYEVTVTAPNGYKYKYDNINKTVKVDGDTGLNFYFTVKTYGVSANIYKSDGVTLAENVDIELKQNGKSLMTGVSDDGTLRITSLISGLTYELVITHNGITTTKQFTVEDEDINIDIVISNVYTVTGTVKDYDGNKVQGAFVSVNGLAGVYTDENGIYSISNVPEGTTVITVTYQGLTVQQNVEVSDNINLDLSLPAPAVVTVSGYIYNQQNDSVANIPVTLKKTNKIVAVTNTDTEGYFVFNNVKSGDYTVAVQLSNESLIEKSLSVGNEDISTEDLIVDYSNRKTENVSNSVNSEVKAIGTVNTASIVVTVPTSIAFVIQPNANEKLYTVPTLLENNSNVPVDFTIQSISRRSENIPNAVLPNIYTDEEWLNLSQEDTENQIALGIKDNSKEYWLDDVLSLNCKTSIEIEPCARFGLGWSQSKDDMNYDMNLLVSLRQ